jgi:hypothetical protein
MIEADRVPSTPRDDSSQAVIRPPAEDQMRSAIRGWLHCSPDRRLSPRALGLRIAEIASIWSVGNEDHAVPWRSLQNLSVGSPMTSSRPPVICSTITMLSAGSPGPRSLPFPIIGRRGGHEALALLSLERGFL